MKKEYNRRQRLKAAAIADARSYLGSSFMSCIQWTAPSLKMIMIVSGWHEVSIGDGAHTSELLNLPLEVSFRKADFIYGHSGKKVLTCTEITYQVDIVDGLLIGPSHHDSNPFL